MSAAILERLRERLEEKLPRVDAAAVLFAALGRWGPRIPTDDSELTRFVHGPLEQELALRFQVVPLKRVIASLDEVLSTAGAPTADHEIPIDIDAPPTWRDEVSTKAMRSIAGPVPVLTIAQTGALAIRLRAVLGDDVIDVEARGDRAGIERALGFGPVLAIIDAVDVTPLAIDVIADALASATQTKAIVWGSDVGYGRTLIDAAELRGIEVSGVAMSDGVGAILDLVISRRAR